MDAMTDPKTCAGAGDAPAGPAAEAAAYGVLELISHAAWVFDLDRGRMVWANRLALQIWNAPSLEELCSRDMGADMSPAVARRLRQYQQDFEHSTARFTEQWTLYPNGQPRTLHMVFCGHRLADGRMALFCEAMDRQQPSDPESIRSVEALLHTEVMISMYGPRGRLLYLRPARAPALPQPGRAGPAARAAAGRAALHHRSPPACAAARFAAPAGRGAHRRPGADPPGGALARDLGAPLP